MKRKRLALLLAAAMTVTSLDSTAMFVSGADFSSEVEEVATQTEEGEETADGDSASVDFSDEEVEVAETPETSETSDAADVEVIEEEPSQDEADVQVEDEATETDFSAELQEDAAADAGAIPTDEAKAIELDTDYTVDLKNTGDSVWYKFTPSESGSYIFSSDSKGNNSMHPRVEGYDPNTSTEYYMASAYDEKDNDFVLNWYLNAGVTYYYQVKLNEAYGEITPFTVRMEKQPEIESASIDFSNAKREFIAGLEQYSAKGVQVTVKYKGQNTPTVLTFGDDYSVNDNKGNYFWCYIDTEEENMSGAYLKAGTYNVIFRNSTEELGKLSITMKKPDASMFDKLNVGKNTVEVKESESAIHWYYFEAETTGLYSIQEDQEEDYDELYICMRKIEKDGTISNKYPDWSSDDACYKMEAGDKYLVGWYDSWSRNVPYNISVTVTKVPKVTSVELIADTVNVKDAYIEYLDYVYPENLKAKVTYEDGSEQILERWQNDSYGRALDCQLCDKDGNYVDESYLAAGDYVFKVSCGGVYADKDIPVKVVALDSKKNAEISDGATDLENNGNILLKYTASESGRYQFDFNVTVSDISIIKADGNSAENISRQDRSAYADLEKGTIYYIYATPDGLCKKLNVNVKLTTRPTALAVKSFRKEAYIAGIDPFDANDMETTVSFGNTSSIVRGEGSVEGYGVGYRLTNENGNTVYSSDTLSKGTWTVTPYLSSGSAIEIPATTTTVESKMYSDAELKALPVLKENDWNSLDRTYGERKIYTFKPSETGAYKVEYTVENYDAPVSIYEATENEYRSMTEIGEENPTVRLDAAKTYLLVNESGAAKVKFTRVNSGLKPETVKELALTDGMKKAVEIDKTVGYIKCTFTPKEDGYYTLKSSQYEGIQANTYVDLYQGSNIIDSNDDDGGKNNFKLTKKLSAGKTYVYEVRFWNSPVESVPFVLEFNKTEKKEIKSADLVLKNGKNAADLSIFDNNIGDFYQLKVTYADGSTWTTDIEGDCTALRMVEDPYGTEIEFGPRWKESLKNSLPESKMDVEITIGYRVDDKWNYDNKKTISFKAAGSLPELKEGQNIKAPKNRTMYKFIPQKTAEYIWGFEGKANIAYATLYTTDMESLYMSPDSCYEGRYENRSAKLEAGKVYYIAMGSYQRLETNETFFIKPVSKTLNGLTVKKNPDKNELLPNNGNQVSLSGLQVEASYTDGTKETITYGKPDSSGRYVHLEDVSWQANGKAKVYVALGRYVASFELEAASWDKVEEIKLGESRTLKIAEGDVETLKFVPKETGIHYINITNGYLTSNIRGTNTTEDRYYYYDDDGCTLKAGETYYITVCASQANPVVKVVAACKDGKHSFSAWNTVKAATCVAEGLRDHNCTICGKYEKEVIPATGKHSMSSWKVTAQATVSAEGSQERTCSVCGKKETAKIAKLKPTIKLNVAVNKTIPLKVKQSFRTKVSGLAKGDKVVSWRTSSKKIATVASNGKVVGKKAGTATITVKLQSGLTAKFKVKVQKSAVATTSLKVVNKATGKTIKSAKLKAKKKLTLAATVAPVTSLQKVTYKSSNKRIATVSSKGVITAKKKGTVTITVKSGKKTVKIKVKVTK